MVENNDIKIYFLMLQKEKQQHAKKTLFSTKTRKDSHILFPWCFYVDLSKTLADAVVYENLLYELFRSN